LVAIHEPILHFDEPIALSNARSGWPIPSRD
jgi:hypothetical protein